MRIIPLAEVAKMGADEIVPAVCATVKVIYKPKAGGEGDKQYKFQNVVLIDGKVEFPMTIKDRFDWDMPDAWKGKRIMVNCFNGTRGLTGVKVKDDSYTKNDKLVEKMVLWVTPTGEIALEGASGEPGSRGSEAPSNEQAPSDNSSGGAPQTQQSAQQPAANGDPAKPNFGKAKKGLLPLANLYFLCCDAVNYVSKCREKVGQPAFDAEDIRAARATLFIEAAKCGLIGDAPTMSLLPHLHTPDSPEAKAAAEQAKKEAAEKAEAKRLADEAAEAERKRKEEAAKARPKPASEESLDEDVPFN